MKLSGEQFQRIHRIVLNAYRNREELSIMVRFELSEILNEIAAGSTMYVTVYSLIEWAETNGRVEELVTGALNQKQNNAELQNLVDELKSWSAAEQGGPEQAGVESQGTEIDVPEPEGAGNEELEKASVEPALESQHPPTVEPLTAASSPIDIFLSYSRKDQAVMQPIRQILQTAGFSTWTDDIGLVPGTRAWQRAVEAAIRNARSLVVLLSPSAKASQWVDRELAMAEALNLPIFPVLIAGDVQTAIPINLITHQWIDSRSNPQAAVQAQLLPVLTRHLNLKPSLDRPTEQTPEQASEQKPVIPVPIISASVISEPSEARPIQDAFPIAFEWIPIPAGPFEMGSKDIYNAMPLHPVLVADFRMAKTPVTNREYQYFVEVTEHRTPKHWENGQFPEGQAEHPVTYVS